MMIRQKQRTIYGYTPQVWRSEPKSDGFQEESLFQVAIFRSHAQNFGMVFTYWFRTKAIDRRGKQWRFDVSGMVRENEALRLYQYCIICIMV